MSPGFPEPANAVATELPRNNPVAVAWLKGFCEAYRRKARSADKAVRRQVHRSQHLGRPTQFVHLWIRAYPPLDIHFLVAAHLPDWPDKEIHSWGPMDPAQLGAALQELDAQPWFHSRIPRRRDFGLVSFPDSTRRGELHDYIDPHLRGLHDHIHRQLFNPGRPDASFYFQGASADVSFTTFHGDLFAQSTKDIVAGFFREAAANLERVREFRREKKNRPPSLPYQEPGPSGYTAVLYPARHIGKSPHRPLPDRLWKGFLAGPGQIVFQAQVGGRRVFATHEGVLGVEEPDKERARRYLNLVCWKLGEMGQQAAYLRPRDLGPFRWRNPAPGNPIEFSSWAYGPDDRRTADEEQVSFFFHWLSKRQVRQAFLAAETLSQDPDADSLIDLLEAEGNLEAEAFRQAFFLGWTIVEKRLAEVWEKALIVAFGDEGSAETEWVPTAIAAGLQRAGLLPSGTVERIKKHKKQRNRILHGSPTNSREAKAMVDTARQAVKELREAERRIHARSHQPTPVE